MDVPYTQKRAAQFRGPSTSDDFNKRIEENYNDLVVLYNRARLSEVELEELFRRMVKDHLSLVRVIDDLEERIVTLENNTRRFTFYSESQIDADRFNADPTFAIDSTQRLSFDTRHGIMTLPKIALSSLSKLFYTDTEGNEVVPSTLEMRVLGVSGTADTPLALIDTSSPEYALYRKPGLIWERNIITDESNPNGAELELYVKVPTDLFTTADANAIVIHPFPYFGCSVREISYTLNVDPLLQESDGYTPFNDSAYYAGEDDAKGWVIPGGWDGIYVGADAAVNSGPRTYYFSPKPITAIRIRLHQATYAREAGKFVYSYGLSHLDLRYDKFLSTGRTILRFDAPDGQTISSVDDVQPQIWNVSPAVLTDVFSYRAIWETAPNSGVYTESPVANSQRVWIEVTLQNTDGWTPALSGLTIQTS